MNTPKIRNTYKYLWLLVIFLFLFKLVLHSVSPLITAYNGFGDAHVRIIMAKNDVIPKYGQWLPLHIRLIQFSLALYENIYTSPRVLSVIISFGLFAAFLFYVKSLHDEQRTLIVAAFLFILNPLISSAFTVPINEPLFAIFFLVACTMLVKRKLFHAVVFFNLAHMIRLESWYFFPIVLFYVLLSRSFREAFFFSLGYFTHPLYWILQNFVYTKDPLFFLSERTQYVLKQGAPYRTLLDVLANWSRIFIIQLGFLNLIAIFYALKKRNLVTFPVISALYLVLMLIIQTYTGSMEWYPEKYVYLPILLVIPAAAAGLVSFGKTSKLYLRTGLLLIALVSVVLWIKQDYFFKAYKFETPEISNSMRVLGASKVIYVYPTEKFPSDRDTLMYYAGTYNYEPYELATNNFDITELKRTYKYALFDNTDYKKVCGNCVLVFQDERFTLVELH